jgi:hypothetical protein
MSRLSVFQSLISFTHQIFTALLTCARLCSRSWGGSRELDRKEYLTAGAHIPIREMGNEQMILSQRERGRSG